MDAVDVIFGQKNSTVTTPGYLTFIHKPMKPSYQELEERVKRLEELKQLTDNELKAAYEVIQAQDEKIERQRKAWDAGTWEAVDLKIDHAKSLR